MSGFTCSEHPHAAATFGCDACGRLLCEACVVEGHRLFFCQPCGERALPLAHGGPATTTESRQAQARATAATYGWDRAFLYPLRGYGIYVLFGYLALIAVFVVIENLLLLGACVTLLPRVGISLLLVPFLMAIARTTAAGDNELPDWPEFDLWVLVGQSLLVFAVAIFALLPTIGLMWLAGGTIVSLTDGVTPGKLIEILGLQTIGLLLSTVLWLLAFGATAVYQTPWLFFRLDLHWRAARVAGTDLVIATLLTGVLLAITPVIWLLVLLVTPITAVAEVLSAAVSIYALLLSAHIAGVLFRRNADSMEAIYLG